MNTALAETNDGVNAKKKSLPRRVAAIEIVNGRSADFVSVEKAKKTLAPNGGHLVLEAIDAIVDQHGVTGAQLKEGRATRHWTFGDQYVPVTLKLAKLRVDGVAGAVLERIEHVSDCPNNSFFEFQERPRSILTRVDKDNLILGWARHRHWHIPALRDGVVKTINRFDIHNQLEIVLKQAKRTPSLSTVSLRKVNADVNSLAIAP